jgi:hypothetical protein
MFPPKITAAIDEAKAITVLITLETIILFTSSLIYFIPLFELK